MSALDFVYSLSKKWVLAYSGGKDSTALLDLAFRYWSGHRDVELTVVYNEVLLNPPVLYDWVYRVLPAVAARGVDVVVTVPREDYITLMLERGYSAPGPSFMWCTRALKRGPVERYIKSVGVGGGRWAVLTGVRLDESAHRARLVLRRCGGACGSAHWVQGERGPLIDVAPIAGWSTAEVVAYLRARRQPWTGDAEDYSFLLDRVYCGRGELRSGCWICTLVDGDEMLKAYAECFGDARYLKIAELKRRLKALSLDWSVRLYKSKKFNEEGRRRAGRLLAEMFRTMPELLRPYAAFKPHVIEEHLPELVPLMKSVEPLDVSSVKVVEL